MNLYQSSPGMMLVCIVCGDRP